MLGAIAAVALVIGTLSATVSVSQDEQQVVSHTSTPEVEMQAVEGVRSFSE